MWPGRRLENVVERLGRPVNPRDVWVIGDTPLDVRCARAVGANVIAVATGWDSLEKLEACRPDVAVEDGRHASYHESLLSLQSLTIRSG